MNRTRSLAAALAVAILLPACLAAAERDDVIHRTFDLAGPQASVLVDNVFGGVTVRAGQPGRVVVDIRRHVEARRADDAARGLSEVVFASRQSGDRIELGQDGPFRCHGWGDERRLGSRGAWGDCDHDDPGYEVRWEWTVEVPPGVDLDVRSVNDGEVVVAGVTGRVEARNVNGPLRLSGLAGAVEATTVNGRLEAEFVRTPPEDSSFRTVNGKIEIALPEDAGVLVDSKTLNGDLYTDFDVTALPQGVAPASEAGGRHRYRIESTSRVRIGAGGPSLTCQTVNGDIVVRSR